jgi:hypothetical protein
MCIALFRAGGTAGIGAFLLHPVCSETAHEFESNKCSSNILSNGPVCKMKYARLIASCGAEIASYIKSAQILLT